MKYLDVPIIKFFGIITISLLSFFCEEKDLYFYLHRHSSSENGCGSKIAAMSWITRSHHIFRVKHLLC